MLQNKYQFASHIKFQSQKSLTTASISEDEKFIVIGGQAQKIQIFHLKIEKLFKNIKLDCDVTIIKFSKDSKILFIGDDYGNLYCYDVMKCFELISKEKLHQYAFYDVIVIDDEQIMTCSYESLQITNFRQKKSLLKIQITNKYIQQVEYDKSRECIWFSQLKVISYMNRKDGEIQIQYQTNHRGCISQIQLISNDNNLASSCSYYLYLWLIDDKNQTLIKVKEFTNHGHYNFTYILNNSYLVLIGHEYAFIIDTDLVIIQQIKHNIKKFQCNYYFINDNSLFINKTTKFIKLYHSYRRKQISSNLIENLQVLKRR